MSLRRGDRVIAFDAIAYVAAGSRDCSCCPDNGCFRKPATVERIHWDAEGRTLVDLRFDARPDRISHSHFIGAITRKLPTMQVPSEKET